MNYKLQRLNLERALKKRGIESDLIDLNAEIDRSLTFAENKRIILQKAKPLQRKQDAQYSRYSSAKLLMKARNIQEKRSDRARYFDSLKKARTRFFGEDLTAKEFKKWKKNPNRFDIIGVD